MASFSEVFRPIQDHIICQYSVGKTSPKERGSAIERRCQLESYAETVMNAFHTRFQATSRWTISSCLVWLDLCPR